MTPEHMFLSDMTAKGNLHPVAEGGSHREMQAAPLLSLVGTQKHTTPSRSRGISWLSPLWGILWTLQGKLVLLVLKTRGMT